MKFIKYFFIALTISIFVGCIINAIFFEKKQEILNNVHPSRYDTSMVDSSLIVTDVDTTFVKMSNNWAYDERPDKMTSKSIYLAQTISSTILDFEFPYDGGASAYLTIRNKDGFNKAYVEMSKGQFLIHSSAKMWKVRFDQKDTDYYLFNPASSGNSKIAFVSRSAEFIENVKKHKKVIIEAEFYQEGLRQMEFDISNLKWDH